MPATWREIFRNIRKEILCQKEKEFFSANRKSLAPRSSLPETEIKFVKLDRPAQPAELDVEMATLPEKNRPHIAADIEVGKLMFRAYLTLSLVRSGIHYDDLASNSSHHMKCFDYKSAIRALQASSLVTQGPLGDEEHQSLLFQIIGFTYRSRSEPEANALIQKLLNPFKITRHTQPTGYTTITTAEWPQGQLHGHDQLHERLDDPGRVASDSDNQLSREDGIHRYTSLLYEECQKWGETPKREETVLSIDPPKFKVTFLFRHIEGSGVARTKKEAGHLAARNVCHQMNI